MALCYSQTRGHMIIFPLHLLYGMFSLLYSPIDAGKISESLTILYKLLRSYQIITDVPDIDRQ